MAEHILKYFHRQRIFVDSVGVMAAEPNGFTIAVMQEIGIDIRAHRPKDFEELLDQSFDLVIALSPEAKHHALEWAATLAVELEYWPSIDPSWARGGRETRLEAWRKARDTLMERILERFPPFS